MKLLDRLCAVALRIAFLVFLATASLACVLIILGLFNLATS